jgi:SAM-dependent methyltransferase
MKKEISNYFATEWTTTETDPYVVWWVENSRNTLDVGCGFNHYKKYSNSNFIGLDPFNSEADVQIDILDFNTSQKFDLIICFGSLHFYNYDWIDERLKKVLSLLDENGRILMKVNPNTPNNDGSTLQWFDRWTKPLAEHFATLYGLKVENVRNAKNGRFKFDFTR